ncbi:tumor necrosis factor receptor superfamily member 5 isoform X2 [Brienomyrus brachyistius]|uniref:tumor necrosis factor receptor superfamily member 5 isoform X2 n=1 Tax=Brienomyrus brachyistius TaxID=42636 RepID=UPI0020B32A4A|nr:tumor necrosis factor receptor superfamily member 5 isoform X2 [Brienomyrus brachyistius]
MRVFRTFFLFLFTCFAVSYPSNSLQCDNQTQYPQENTCCNFCEPGYRLENPCKGGSPNPKCKKCNPGFYMDTYNKERQCHTCFDCTMKYMMYVLHCTSTSNSVCGCVPGYRCTDTACSNCKRITSETPDTPPEGLEKLTPTEAAETSAPCEPGAFYSETFRKCEKHKNCTSLGLSVVTAGNSTHDAVCDSPTTSAVSKISPVHTAPVSPVKEGKQFWLEKSLLFLCVVCVCISVFLIGVNFASRCHLSKWRASGLRIPRDVEEEDVQKPIQEVCGKLETCYTENY